MTFADMMKAPLPANLRRDNNINESTENDNVVEESLVDDVPAVDTPADPTPGPVAPATPAAASCPNCGDAGCDGSCKSEDLTPEEDQRVDDVMNTVATPMLLASELDDNEVKEYVESLESDIAVSEGFLTERTIVRFDKNAKKAQLYEVAVRAVAREKKDPLYRKLETVEKMKRIIEAKLRKKYDAPARRKVKEYLDRAKKSKSGILSKIASKISGK